VAVVSLLGAVCYYFFIRDAILHRISLSTVARLLFGSYFMFWAGSYIAYNKIELTDRALITSALLPGRNLLLKFDRKTVGVEQIASVELGRMTYLSQRARENDDELYKMQAFWENSRGGAAAKFTPLMLVRLKEGKSAVVSTKPFSRRGFRTLFAELKSRNIPTEVQEGAL